jgi:creatinine amidohydrolase
VILLLENMAWPEVEAYLQENDVLLMPVGSTEQHSPYGLMGTDFIAAEAVAREAGEKMGLLVTPTLPFGCSAHHMGFSGTASLGPATYVAVVTDLVRAFLHHGLRRIVVVNGHGGNVHAIQSAFDTLKAGGAPGVFALVNWYEQEAVSRLARELFGEGEGQHATPSEVSVTRRMRPGAFSGKPVDPVPMVSPKHPWPLSAEAFRTTFPDGRMGSAPWLASADHGRRLVECAADALCERLRTLMGFPLL